MSTSAEERKQGLALPRAIFKINPVAIGCTLLMLASGAYAQNTLETVTVTGIRKGIEDAISVKKNSDSIVESISAEDIGKLPDSSVAESIARLPGVTAQRTSGGRAQQISIRGMAPDFATGLLNGREQVSTGDSRSIEFDQYPSELLSGVTIYKTPDGALIGQGLSGTIDLQTVRPLNFSKRAIAINARKQRTGVGAGGDAGTGDRESFSYIDQFADRTIGVALGFARFKEDGAQSQRFDSWGSWTPDVANGTSGKVKVPGGFARFVDQTKQTRTGLMGVIQFKPNANFESTLDLFSSQFDIKKSTKGFQAPVAFGGNYDADGVLSNAVVANGYATSGTMSNFKAVIRNDIENTKDKLNSIGWNNKLKLSEWTAVADIAHSSAKKTGAIMETTAGTPGPTASDTISWTGFNGNNFGDVAYKTGLNYAEPNVTKLTDVEGWGGGTATPQAGYSKLPNVEDTLNSLRLSGKRELTNAWIFSGLTAGLNVSDRKKTRAYVEGRLVVSATDPYASVAAPGAGTVSSNGLTWLTFDPAGLIGSTYQIAPKRERTIANKDWTVKEKVTTLFTKLDIDTQMFGLPVRGNAGLQLVNTDQSSTAFNVDGAACPLDVCPTTTVSAGTKYSNVLPSLNLVFDAGSDQSIRLGAARVMARPTISDMRASLGFGNDATHTGGAILTGDAGNPNLKPFLADSFDISYEKYFGNKAYVGAAAFYKKLNTYILKVQDVVDFKQYANGSTPLPGSGPNQGSTIGLLTHPINGSGGNINGIELSANLPLNMLTSWLDGFGTLLSYSNTSSSVKLPTSGVSAPDVGGTNIPLPGLSKNVSSWTMYYEKYGFSVRYAQRYRSSFVGEVSDFTGDRQLTYIKAENVADVQIGYEFQSGYLKGLSVLGQILNVNKADYVRYKETPSNEIERVRGGKTYLFGLNYKL